MHGRSGVKSVQGEVSSSQQDVAKKESGEAQRASRPLESVQMSRQASGLSGTSVMERLEAQRAIVQRSGGDAGGAAGVHAAAAHGVQGSGQQLPHLGAIQHAFGRHDVSGVQAHVGGAAREATTAMGAQGYATGNQVAFRDSPSLHLAAHEAAHVVQQRAGVSLSGGVSQAGDSYERHADAVADAVVQGRSAEPLLDQMSGGGASSGVQRKEGDVVQADLGDVGDWLADRIGDATNSRPDEERLDAEEELETFMGQTYEEDHFHPSTGRGNFDADYNPRQGQLTISVTVFFQFRDGSPSNPDWVANTAAGDPTFNAADFQWTDEEKTQFAATTIQMVQQHWSRRYTFHCTREHWDALPDVNVDVVVTEAESVEAAHYNIEVFKWPDDRVDGAHIDRPGVNHGGDHAGHQHDSGTDDDHVGGEFNESAADGSVATPDVSNFRRTTNTRAAYGQAATDNPTPILFEQDSAQITPAEMARIQTFTTTMSDAAMPDFPLTVIGRSSSEGDEEHNQLLSEDRARVVSNELVSGGVKSQPTVRGEGESGATEDPEWRRVEIVIGDFRANQTTILHEFGHVLGLGDEYPTGDGGSRDVGTEVAHSDLAENLGLAADPVVAHHSDSIMSNGEVVEPYHYATFLEVLGTMTNTTGEWEAGAGPGPDRGPGDFPVPTPGGSAMA